MIFKLCFVIFYYDLVFCDFVVTYEQPIVVTSSGKVMGLTINILNQSIDQFLGIPYAVPPIGSLRFAKPKAIETPLKGIIDATKPKNSCFQKNVQFNGDIPSEDCLVLNIWSQKKLNKSKELIPVMFWIYGGGLKSGSIFSMAYDGSVLATHDVVLVSVNYRVGPLGFLYGGQDSAPGNVGFFDQLLGLQWVRKNIHLFGGDKNQITIFGQSAGSWSVSAQIVSPLSKGLFNKAIMQSGAHMFNKDRPVISKVEALNSTKRLAESLNCTDDKQWLQCLRKVDAKLFINRDQIFPVVGTEFLPFSAQNAFTQMKYNQDIDLMAGITMNEGSSLGLAFFHQLKSNVTKDMFSTFVTTANTAYHFNNTEQAINYYLDNIDTGNSTALRRAAFDYFGDLLIKCPTYLFAKQFAIRSPKSKTYFYELTYESNHFSKQGCNQKTMGICHAADVEFVFGSPLRNSNPYTELDIDFSRHLMNMWTKFAKSGNPGSIWPQLLDSGSSLVKILNPYDSSGVLTDPLNKNCDQFWKNEFI